MNYSTKTIIDKNSFNILEVLKDTEDYNDAFVAKIKYNSDIAILKIARNELLENEWTAMKKLSGTGTAPKPLAAGNGFIVESLVDGVTLNDALTEELTVAEAVLLLEKLVEATVTMRERKVCVNDAHFKNYVVSKDLDIVAIDLGLDGMQTIKDACIHSSTKTIRMRDNKHYDCFIIAQTFYYMLKDVLSFRDMKLFHSYKSANLKRLLREVTYQQSLLEPVDTDALKQKLFHDEASLTC